MTLAKGMASREVSVRRTPSSIGWARLARCFRLVRESSRPAGVAPTHPV